MIELCLTCRGSGLDQPHEFKRQFLDPVDWKALNMALADRDPRCELHPEIWHDPNRDWA
jgi:hypothetical protein